MRNIGRESEPMREDPSAFRVGAFPSGETAQPIGHQVVSFGLERAITQPSGEANTAPQQQVVTFGRPRGENPVPQSTPNLDPRRQSSHQQELNSLNVNDEGTAEVVSLNDEGSDSLAIDADVVTGSEVEDSKKNISTAPRPYIAAVRTGDGDDSVTASIPDEDVSPVHRPRVSAMTIDDGGEEVRVYPSEGDALPEGDHGQTSGGVSGERSVQIDNFLNHYIGDPYQRIALSTRPPAAVPSDVTLAVHAGFEALPPTDRTKVITALIQGQVAPGLLPVSDVEGNRRAARALLSHLPLDLTTRADAVQAYSEAVASLESDTSIESLEALIETSSTLLTRYNRSAKVLPEEVSLGKAVWAVTQQVDQARSSMSPAEEVEIDPVQERREAIARLSDMGFRTRLIGRVTGYSALNVASDLSKMRKDALQSARDSE